MKPFPTGPADIERFLEPCVARTPSRSGAELERFRDGIAQGIASAMLEGALEPDAQLRRMLDLFADGRLTIEEYEGLCLARHHVVDEPANRHPVTGSFLADAHRK